MFHKVTIPTARRIIIPTAKRFSSEILWTPESLSTEIWLDAQDYATISEVAGAVSLWNDKSGNGNDFEQLTGSKQPTYNAVDSVLGLPSLSSVNGTGDQLDCLNSTTVKRIYAVSRYDDGVTAFWQNHNCLCGNVATGEGSRLTGRTGGIKTDWDASGIFCDGGAFKNGGTVDETANATPMPSTLWKFDSTITVSQNWRILGNGASYSTYGGAIGEMIFTDGGEDLATQQKVEGYLAWKWNLTASLDGVHPYKNARPTV